MSAQPMTEFTITPEQELRHLRRVTTDRPRQPWVSDDEWAVTCRIRGLAQQRKAELEAATDSDDPRRVRGSAEYVEARQEAVARVSRRHQLGLAFAAEEVIPPTEGTLFGDWQNDAQRGTIVVPDNDGSTR